MSNTVDLVKAASDRSYMKFEDQALDMLKTKVQENPVMKDLLAKLDVAQGITEGEKPNFGKDKDEDEGEEKEKKDSDEDEDEDEDEDDE